MQPKAKEFCDPYLHLGAGHAPVASAALEHYLLHPGETPFRGVV